MQSYFLNNIVISSSGDSDSDIAIGLNQWSSSDYNDRVVKKFSAICLLTAMEIAEKLGRNHTLGLIGSYKGATSIEKWMPYNALRHCKVATSEELNPNYWISNVSPFLRHAIKGVLWFQGCLQNVILHYT